MRTRVRTVLGNVFFAALTSSAALGCARTPIVATTETLPVRRVVVYRNGVAYFQRAGHVDSEDVRFKMKQTEVGDFLATLAVMERGGSSVRAAAFPLKADDEPVDEDTPPPPRTEDQKRGLETVVLSLDGKSHDLQVGYVTESPVWKPSYRLVVHAPGDADLQAWGIVENLTGEDWTDVKLTLVAGAPLAFRADLGNPVIPFRPAVTDSGEVIAAVPHGETSLAQSQPAPAPPPSIEASTEVSGAIAPTGGEGFGSGRGRLGGGHAVKAPQLREGATSVNGRLPPEVIRRIVRQNMGRFRLCFQNGLKHNPTLRGRVSVKFIIDRQGAVSMTADGGSDLPDPSVVGCVVRGFSNLSFPAPEGGMVTVVYPIMFSSGDDEAEESEPPAPPPPPPEPSAPPIAGPRDLRSLAAIGVEGGATRYDLPVPVTVPDRSATMVMLVSRPVPGEALFLFAPDGGVSDSQSHPFRVGRFTNNTPGLLERGPIAVFDDGTFLGQGVLDPLPAGATATVPFALERGIAVDVDHKYDEVGGRIAKIENAELTIERERVTQTIYRLKNGSNLPAKILVKHPRVGGARLFSPPPGTEDNVGTSTALVPTMVAPGATSALTVDERTTELLPTDWFTDLADAAVKAYLADPKLDAGVAQKLNAAWGARREVISRREEKQKVQQQYDQLTREAEETRRNLAAIEKNKTADALRKKLTARLAESASHGDDLNRKIIELDSKLSELTVQFREGIRDIRLALPVSP
jgi:hypothetical protein